LLYLSFFYSPLGRLGIAENGASITNIFLTDKKNPQGHFELGDTPLLQRAVGQLKEYFAGQRKDFDLPLNPAGTPFQQKVWSALSAIPYASTCSYKEVALKIGHPQAFRAVGGANNRNPIMVIIPCHRVIGSNGKLVGYGGGLEVKDWLLQLEQNNR